MGSSLKSYKLAILEVQGERHMCWRKKSKIRTESFKGERKLWTLIWKKKIDEEQQYLEGEPKVST